MNKNQAEHCMALLLWGSATISQMFPKSSESCELCAWKMSSIGWVYYSHNGKLYALKFQQNSWCELWGWAGRREGRRSVLVIEKKNVNGVLNLVGNFKALNQWLEGRARALRKTQQTKEKGLSLQWHYLQRSWFLEPEICLDEKILILDQEILK